MQPLLFPGISPLASFFLHPDLRIASKLLDMKPWVEKGLSQFQDLAAPRSSFNVDYVRRKMETQYKKFLALSKKLLHKEEVFRPLTMFERLLSTRESKGLLSWIYAILLRKNSGKGHTRARWEKDLRVSITEKEWPALIRNNVSFSCNVAIQGNRFKLCQRWYLTPVRIQKIFKAGDARCWRCKATHAGDLQLRWSCPVVTKIWGGYSSDHTWDYWD